MATSNPTLPEIKARLAAATKGPWNVKAGATNILIYGSERHKSGQQYHVCAVRMGSFGSASTTTRKHATATLIANSPTDIAQLVEWVEERDVSIAHLHKVRAVSEKAARAEIARLIELLKEVGDE